MLRGHSCPVYVCQACAWPRPGGSGALASTRGTGTHCPAADHSKRLTLRAPGMRRLSVHRKARRMNKLATRGECKVGDSVIRRGVRHMDTASDRSVLVTALWRQGTGESTAVWWLWKPGPWGPRGLDKEVAGPASPRPHSDLEPCAALTEAV